MITLGALVFCWLIAVWFLRNLLGFIILVVFIGAFLSGNSNSGTNTQVLSYQELVDYPSQCSKADEQLAELKELQRIKNFNQDPDMLNDDDRAYNSRLKASIWWYAYRCGKS